MRTALVAVGRLRPAFREACDEYLARLRRYGEVTEREIREAAGPRPPVHQRRDESRRLLAGIPEGATVVALDREGTGWTSEALAGRLQRWRETSRPVALVIGGSLGPDPELVARADHRWSLGPL